MTVDVGIHEVRCENVFDPNNPFIARGSAHPDWARYEIVVPTDDVPPEAVTPPVKVQVLLITPEGEDPRWEVAYGTPGLVDAQYALYCGLVVVAAARLADGLNAVGVGR